MTYFLIATIFIAATYYSVQPLFEAYVPATDSDEFIESLLLKKRVLYRQIKELDLDYDLGNIAVEDYRKIRDELKLEVSALIDQINSKKNT
ncbi:MAG: hypothetical protein ACE5D8_05895 [Fidelibacterota bacterium]